MFFFYGDLTNRDAAIKKQQHAALTGVAEAEGENKAREMGTGIIYGSYNTARCFNSKLIVLLIWFFDQCFNFIQEVLQRKITYLLIWGPIQFF